MRLFKNIFPQLTRYLLVGILLLSTAVQAQILDIASEIRQTQAHLEELKASHSASITDALSGEIKIFDKYLESLTLLQKERPKSLVDLVKKEAGAEEEKAAAAASSEEKPAITSGFKKWLLAGIKRLDHLTGKDISADSIHRLFEHVESNHPKWKSGEEAPQPFILKDTANQEIQVNFELDDHGKVYAEFGNFVIGTGQNKEVVRVLDYKNWTRVARLFMKHESDSMGAESFARETATFEREKKHLNLISELPEEKQVGLVKTLHIGKHIYQPMYHMDLFTLMEQHFLSREVRLEIGRKLIAGMTQFHSMGLIFADIKPENVLIKFPKISGNPIDAVLSDFGFAIDPFELITAGSECPSRGSPHYAAPEVIAGPDAKDSFKGWYGNSPNERAKNAFKMDVFSMSVVLDIIMHYNVQNETLRIEWMMGACDKNLPNGQLDFGYFFNCRERKINELRAAIEKKKSMGTATAIEALIADGLHPNQIERISSEEFSRRFTAIMNPEQSPPAVVRRLRIPHSPATEFKRAAQPRKSSSAGDTPRMSLFSEEEVGNINRPNTLLNLAPNTPAAAAAASSSVSPQTLTDLGKLELQ